MSDSWKKMQSFMHPRLASRTYCVAEVDLEPLILLPQPPKSIPRLQVRTTMSAPVPCEESSMWRQPSANQVTSLDTRFFFFTQSLFHLYFWGLSELFILREQTFFFFLEMRRMYVTISFSGVWSFSPNLRGSFILCSALHTYGPSQVIRGARCQGTHRVVRKKAVDEWWKCDSVGWSCASRKERIQKTA